MSADNTDKKAHVICGLLSFHLERKFTDRAGRHHRQLLKQALRMFPKRRILFRYSCEQYGNRLTRKLQLRPLLQRCKLFRRLRLLNLGLAYLINCLYCLSCYARRGMERICAAYFRNQI